jgi:lipopolysaccharide/colanic/teichoic acid biosynthesis glycosyltransferase
MSVDLSACGYVASGSLGNTKRFCDFVLALILALVLLPLGLIGALAVWLDSPGPIIYRQARVGLNGVVFTVYKFRSMQSDAEDVSGPVLAQTDDPRVTRVGRVMRTLHLDELPQLYNVLLGSMSIVGPRPERPEFVDVLAATIPLYDQRHLVKPGLTGLAQINLSYAASARNKLRYDLIYVQNYSSRLDLQIIIRTLKILTLGIRI